MKDKRAQRVRLPGDGPEQPPAPVTGQVIPESVLSPAARREVARFLRPQPPLEVPRRSWTREVPGLVALSLLGGRVIRRLY